MPNHVDNDLFVTGDPATVAEFVKAVKSDESTFDANNLIPYPKTYREMDAMRRAAEAERPDDPRSWPRDGFNSGGYEWCLENWGSKWGAYDVALQHEQDDSTAYYGFRSAWAPIRPVILEAAKRFPTLRLEHHYFEQGMAFMGVDVYEGGHRVTEFRTGYHGPRGG